MRRFAFVSFCSAVVFVVAIGVSGWANSYQSCLRSMNTRRAIATGIRFQIERAAQRAVSDDPADRRIDLEAVQQLRVELHILRPKDCLVLLPPV